jgi:hypothetical protein
VTIISGHRLALVGHMGHMAAKHLDVEYPYFLMKPCLISRRSSSPMSPIPGA